MESGWTVMAEDNALSRAIKIIKELEKKDPKTLTKTELAALAAAKITVERAEKES
jgi:hypothetical protein